MTKTLNTRYTFINSIGFNFQVTITIVSGKSTLFTFSYTTMLQNLTFANLNRTTEKPMFPNWTLSQSRSRLTYIVLYLTLIYLSTVKIH